MPTDPYLPEGRNFPRTRSPDASVGGSERKRRRKVLSCYDCRRRKLQCDRALPACSRCTKAGQAANCLYLEDASDAPIRDEPTPNRTSGKLPEFYGHSLRPLGAAGPTGDLLSRLEYQDGRIKQLEAALAQAGQGGSKTSRLPLTPESIAGAADVAPVQDRETTLLRGKSFKTQFHGSTHPGALIARIPELNKFTRDTFEQFPALSRIKEDMGALETRKESIGLKHNAVSDSDLQALLPPKDEADVLVKIYIDNYGSLYHVLHLPSFYQEYEGIYAEPGNVRSHFVALVLVIMAAAQCLTTTDPWLYSANSSLAREKAIAAIAAVDDWLMAQSQKHVSAIDFQIRVLLLLAKQVTARKMKRTWTESGNVLRFCMAAGLHRTPDLVKKQTSVLDKELRRRVWASVIELELQSSFDRGMIASPWTLQSDCPAPHHLSDDDLDQTTEHLPALRRANDFNDSSFLCLSSESIMLRTTLNTYLNNIRQPISFEEAKRYTDEIENHLQSLPDWSEPSSEIASTLLSLNLRQYVLVLHDRQIRNADTKAERDFSRMILVETAVKMIESHKKLTSKGCYALELLCCDHLRAALSLCHIFATSDPRADDALTRAINESALRVIPDAIEMLTDKVIRFGREQRLLWILLAAFGHVKSRRDPEKRLIYMQEAVDKVTRPYYKIMACQVDAPVKPSENVNRAVAARPQTSDREMTDRVPEYYPPPMPQPEIGGVATDQPLLDLDDIAAWTFEDWSFNPADIAANFNMGGYGPTI